MRCSTIIVGTDCSEPALKAGILRFETGACDVTKGDPDQAPLTTARERATHLIVVSNLGVNTHSARCRPTCPNVHRAMSSSRIR
jgi:hypothetical protein